MSLTIEEKRQRAREYMRRWSKENPERRKAERKRYWQKNREKILAKRKAEPRTVAKREYDRVYAKQYKKAHPEKAAAASARWWRRHHAENLAKAAIARKVAREARAGRPRPSNCEICNNPSRGRWKVLHFDHCHQRGIFRGWICNSCNVVLGYVNDDPDHLRKLVAYLERTAADVSPQLELPV